MIGNSDVIKIGEIYYEGFGDNPIEEILDIVQFGEEQFGEAHGSNANGDCMHITRTHVSDWNCCSHHCIDQLSVIAILKNQNRR